MSDPGPLPTSSPPASAAPLASPARASSLLLALALPVVLLQLLVIGSLVLGRETLYLRDVLATHLPMKQAEAMALRHGELPELDPYRGGGQPLLGNLNGAPFYPDTLLYLVASPLWALNAHFWLHFLVAPWSFAWLARRLGLDRPAAWVGGAVYATSGFFLSQMSFYNLVAGVALAPAFVAACLAARDAGVAAGRRGWRPAAAAGALWSLLLLGGEPAIAALALGAAVLAVVTVARLPPPEEATAGALSAGEGDAAAPVRGLLSRWGPLLLALACGTAVAAPQVVELLRVVGTSTRGMRGYDATARTLGQLGPATGHRAAACRSPSAASTAPGAGGFWGQPLPHRCAAVLPHPLPRAAAAGAGGGGGAGARAGRRLRLDGARPSGCFVALGRFNPLLAPLVALPGGSLVRFPVKAVAAGGPRFVDARGGRVGARGRRGRSPPRRAVCAATFLVTRRPCCSSPRSSPSPPASRCRRGWPGAARSAPRRWSPARRAAGRSRSPGLAGLAGTLAALLERRASAAATDTTAAAAASARRSRLDGSQALRRGPR